MSKQDIIRAWKDEQYRDSLSEAERSQLPENPAGLIELPDEDLANAAGGTTTTPCATAVIYGARSSAACGNAAAGAFTTATGYLSNR